MLPFEGGGGQGEGVKHAPVLGGRRRRLSQSPLAPTLPHLVRVQYNDVRVTAWGNQTLQYERAHKGRGGRRQDGLSNRTVGLQVGGGGYLCERTHKGGAAGVRMTRTVGLQGGGYTCTRGEGYTHVILYTTPSTCCP